jgi:hypothetical protein
LQPSQPGRLVENNWAEFQDANSTGFRDQTRPPDGLNRGL